MVGGSVAVVEAVVRGWCAVLQCAAQAMVGSSIPSRHHLHSTSISTTLTPAVLRHFAVLFSPHCNLA